MSLNIRKHYKLLICGQLVLASVAAYADPFSIVAGCQVTSVIPGQAKCQLSISLSDSYLNPAQVRKSQLKVNNVLVFQGNNDTSNPVTTFSNDAFASVAANCGGTYSVTGFIARI